MSWKQLAGAAGIVAVVLAASANAEMRITEWMYNDTPEFIEFTNVGGSPIDMTNWSFDDDSQTPGTVSLSSLGTVSPGESVLLIEGPAAAFRAAWASMPGINTVKIVDENTTNLGRNDEINLFNSANALVDRLTYGDQNFPGTIRTQNNSGIPITPAAIGANNVAQWRFSIPGSDGGFNTVTNAIGQIGNPGFHPGGVIPEPASAVMLALAAAFAAIHRRR